MSLVALIEDESARGGRDDGPLRLFFYLAIPTLLSHSPIDHKHISKAESSIWRGYFPPSLGPN